MPTMTSASELPPFEYDSEARRLPALDEFVELLRYRDLIRLFVASSIKTRYKRSTLGVVWTLLNPLLTMLVLTIAFSNLFRGSLPNYPIYILSGLIFWNFFNQTTILAMNSLIWGGSLLKRIYLPRTIFSVAAVGTGLVNVFLALVPMGIIMLILGHPFRVALLFLPVAILIMAMFTLGVALCVSTLAVFFTDVIDMYNVLLSALFYLTAVIYPKSILPEPYVHYLNLNPLYHLLECFRMPIYAGTLPSADTITTAVLTAVVALAVGWLVFTQRADGLAYQI